MISVTANIVSFVNSVFKKPGWYGIKLSHIGITCFLLVLTNNAFSQTGPGGVGNSSSTLLWLKADAGISTTINGSPVSTWLDQSGNGKNATQGTANLQPKFVSNATNGKPSILFNNASDAVYDYLNLPAGFDNFTGGISALVVTKPNSTLAWSEFFNLGGGASDQSDALGFMRDNNTTNFYYEVYRNWIEHGISGNSLTNGAYQVIAFRQNGGTPPATSTSRLYKNNSLIATNAIINVPENLMRNSNFICHDSQGLGDYDGEIAEIIIYNFTMNSAQNIIIENYLSSKYGIVLTANDYFSFDATHGNDVTGIGRVDASNFHNNATSAGILNISNPSSLTDNEWLLFGHNNGSISSWTTTGAPSASIKKIPREWRINKTGDVGTVTFSVDLSSFPSPPDPSCAKYVLMVDADGDFTSGSSIYNLIPDGGNKYHVNAVTTGDGNYVSIGVRLSPIATISPDPAQVCAGGTLNMNGNPSGGSGTYTSHLWSGNTSPLSSTVIQNPTFSTSTINTYNLTYTVTDNIGCTGSNNISVSVVATPTGPTLSTKTPNQPSVCNGQMLSATFNSGTGGVGCSDSYQYRFDGGSWNSYTPGSNLDPAGHTIIEIQGQRAGCSAGAGCSGTSWVTLASWNISAGPAATLGYTFEKSITIDPALVAGPVDLVEFPVLINISGDNDLKTTVNGGSVFNTNGYDILFVDQNGNKLDHEIELYDGSAGRIIAWVKIPTLSTSVNTVIKIVYSNPQVSTNPSTKSVWDSEYKGVWHLQNTNDATINNNNGSALPGAASTAGLIGNAYLFNGTTGYLRIPDNSSLDLTTELTLSAWINVSALGNYNRIVAKSNATNSLPYTMYGLLFDNFLHTRLELSQGNSQTALDGNTVIPTSQWKYVVGTYNGTTRNLFVNGVSAGTSNTITGNFDQNNIPLTIGASDFSNSPADFFNGTIDEVRVLSSAKSADWITTEYNNQKPASAFYSVSGKSNHSVYDFDVCANSIGVIYSVPAYANQTYNWTVTGGSFTGNGTNQISVNWGASGTGNVSLSVTNTISGCSNSSLVYSVIKNPVPVPVISGNLTVCPNKISEVYSSANIVGHSYNWIVTGDVSFTGNGTNQISVDWGAGPLGTITLTEAIVSTGCSTIVTQNITIQDNTPPVISGCPTDITVPTGPGRLTCNQTATWTEPTALDNCLGSMTYTTRSHAPGSIFPVGTTAVTYTFNDTHGNTSTCSFNVIVQDNTPPVISGCPTDITVQTGPGRLTCDQTATWTEPTALDNCLGSMTYSTRSHAPGSTFTVGTTAVIYTFNDTHGNTSSCTFNVIVQDNTPPVISGCPTDITVQTGAGRLTCNQTATWTEPTALDNCLGSMTYTTRSIAPGSTFTVGTTAVTYTFNDTHGNISTCTFNVIVQDNTPPAVIGCPTDITVPTGPGKLTCDQTATWTEPTALDNCLGSMTYTTRSIAPGSTFTLGTTPIIYTFNDTHGNTSTCTFNVIVQDNTPPAVIGCPTDITVPTGPGRLTCDQTATWTEPTALDNCLGSMTYTTRSHAPGSTFPVGTTAVTYTFNDTHGNTSTCTFNVIVQDNTPPVISGCPTDITVQTGPGKLTCDQTATWTEPTALDNCLGSMTYTTRSHAPGSIFPVGTTAVTYTFNDTHGNTSTCTFNVIVQDNTPPVITSCPPDITINCEADNTPSGTGSVSATDNCTPAVNIVIEHSDVSTYNSDPSNILHYNYTITRTWTVTDVAGNSSNCIQTITVQDVTKPVITCPVDITINCEADNSPAVTGTATVTDNCSPVANVTVVFSDLSTYDSNPASGYHYNYSIARTWHATDISGNFNECIQTINVHDITKPVIICPPNVTIHCEADNTPAGTGIATATDNCTPVANLTVGFSDFSTYNSDPASVLHYNYTIVRTWRATDISGNFNECLQTITVHDIANPVISCPINVTIGCDADNTPTGTGTATATDICTPSANIIITHSDAGTYSPDPASILHYNYTIIRTWRAMDVAGNQSSCTQTIAVHDITNPVISCPGNVTISCEDNNTPAGTGTASATDNCAPSANIIISHSDMSTYNIDPANLLHYNYTITRTWRATDVAGNFRECIQIITVHDITKPVINCPIDITVSCEADHSPAGTGIPTATDNCAPSANLTFSHVDNSTFIADPTNILHYNYTILRTWRATDVSGNFIECVQTITVHDITAPAFTVPAAITICRASDCTYDISTSVTGDVTDESDNCAPSSVLNATFTDDLSGLIDCNNHGFILRTWSLTDIAGNTTVKVQTIQVEPTPAVTVINNSPVICDGGTVNLVINSPTVSITSSMLSYVVSVTSSDPAHLGGTASLGFTVVKSDLPFTFTGTLINSSDAPITVTYTVTPELSGCSNGSAQTATIIVNPTPQVLPDKFVQTICNDGTTNVTLGSPSTFTSGLITFDYTVTSSGGVTGFITPLSGLPLNSIISDILHNPTDEPQTVTYTIVPVSPTGCAAGPAKTVIITVDPTPQVVPGTLAQTICNEASTNISLGSPSIFASGVITFDYTVTATGGVTGFNTPVTGLTKDHVISDVLSNPSDVPQTVTYTIVPLSPTGCTSGPSKVVVVTVNPTPQVLPGTLTQTICNSGTTNITLGSQSIFTSGVITFNFTATATGGITGFTASATGLPKDHIISDVLNNPSDSPQTVTYIIVPLSPTGCAAGPAKTVVVTVNPTPQVIPSAFTQKVCNNGTTSIVLTSPSTFSNGAITFDYTVVATGGVSGFTTPVAGLPINYVISDVLTNPTNDPQTVTYTIVPVSPSGCAAGPVKIVVVTVEPTPQVVPSTLSQIICNDATTNILLTSPSTFTNGVITFNYTVVATGGVTGYTTPVIGLPNNHVISDLLHNPTDVPQSVIYTIVPISPECSASDPIKIVTIIVNPTPQVIPSTLTQTICNDGTTNVILASQSTFTSGVITFNYTAVATGGVTGFASPVTALPRDHVIADILHNPTDIPQTVTYTITPVSPTGCPDGPTKVVIITVNPTPQVVPSILAETICNDVALNITLESPSTFNNGLITFNYTVTATGGVTGFITPVTGLPKDYVISDILHNPTDSPQTVTYTIVPESPSGCASGPAKVIIITVNPTPQVIPSTLTQTICNDGTTNIILGSASTFTSGLITFNYTVVATGGVTGYTSPVTGLPKDHIIADILHNPTNSPQTVTYTVVPISPTGCAAGPIKTIFITVNPTPQVIPGTPAQTICNDGTVNVILGSPSTFTTGVITFNYTVTATGGVTGFTTPLTGLLKDHVIADVLHNPTDSPQTVTYIIVPISPTGCPAGPAKVVVITINPTPQVVPGTLAQTICNDGSTNISLGSPSTFTSGVITFNYTVAATGGVTGFTTPVTGLPKGHVITDVLHNPTDSPQTVTYTIVPLSPTGCPAGPVKIVVITVNPTPQVIPSTLNQTICNDAATSITLASPSIFTSGLITFNYTVTATGGVTGFTTPVTGLPRNFIISNVLHNPTNVPQTVTYTIVPVSPTGCASGPIKTVVITVNPTPQVNPSTLAQTICNDGTTSITLASPSIFSNGPIKFNYTVIATGGVTGFVTPVTGLPKDFVISDILHNPTDSPQTATYTIVPVSPTLCTAGPAKVVIVTINPTPRIFPIPSNSTQCDSLTTNIRLQSPSVFTAGLVTFKYTVTTTGSVSGYTTPVSGMGNNQIIGDKLINNTDHYQTVTYRIVPVSPAGCIDGVARDISIIVNPTPKVIPSNNFPAICYIGTLNGAPVNTQIVLNSPTVMTSGTIKFDYTVTVTGGPGVIVGNTAPASNLSTGYTINLAYQNNSAVLQSVYYSITPKVDNAICVPGRTVKSEVKVHAQPLQNIIVTKPLTCTGGAGLAALRAVISQGADPYHVDWRGPVGYHKVDSLDIANLSSGKYVITVIDNLGCNRSDSLSIVPVTARPYISPTQLNPGNYHVSCINATDGEILVSVTGGITPPYNYWVIKNDIDTLYNGIFTNNLSFADPTTYRYYTNLGAGSYTLVTRDVNGCENFTRIVFRVPPVIVPVFNKSTYAGGYNISCKGYNDGSVWVQSITGARGSYLYRWFTFDGNIPGPDNTNRIDNITAGKYYLETSDSYYPTCVKIDSITITQPDGMNLSGSVLSKSPDGNYNISCNGSVDGSISMTIAGGSGNYLFSWTGPSGYAANTKDITGLKTGTYTCLVKDLNGCTLVPSPTYTLTEPLPLVINPPIKSISNDGAYNINCYGANTGTINIAVSGGSIGNYKYVWSTTNGSGIINGQKDQTSLTAGTYHLVVSDLNNCVTSADISLTQPPDFVAKLTRTNITCQSPGFNNGSINLTVTGGIAPYSYLWSNGEITEDLIGLIPGDYEVTVTDFNGCIKKVSTRIDLPPALTYTRNISNFNGFNISCNGMANGFISIDPTTGVAPFVYSWTGPNGFTSSVKNISDLIAGQYQLQLVDSNQCKASEIFNLTEPGKLGMTFSLPSSTAGGFNINCAGDNTGYIDIEPVNQVSTVDYLWEDGIFGKTRTNLLAGNYSIIITDANNCHASAVVTLTQPDSLKIVFDITPPFCPDKPDGVILTSVSGGVKGADYFYRWADNSTNRNLSNVTRGFYKITVTDLNGCIAKDSVKVDPINETCLVLPKAFSPNGDLINDVWNIGMKELYPKMEVKIFNRWGESVWRSEKGYPIPWDGKSNGAQLPIDSYHYVIDLHNGSRPIIGNVTIVR